MDLEDFALFLTTSVEKFGEGVPKSSRRLFWNGACGEVLRSGKKDELPEPQVELPVPESGWLDTGVLSVVQ